VLTRDHALGAVAGAHLGLTDPVVDAASVLAWTADPGVAARVADLRALAGDALTTAVLDWAAGCAGTAGRPLLVLLRGGETRDAVPLGLVAGLLADARDGASPAPGRPASADADADAAQVAREALIRLEPRLGGAVPPEATLRAWARESAAVVTGMLQDRAQHGNALDLLGRADELLAGTHADGLAGGSDLLPAGLTRRLASLADALRAALPGSPAGEPASPDALQVTGAGLATVERAWAAVAAHQLTDADPRTGAFHAAVRLARWLAGSSAVAGTSLPVLLGRHRDSDAWADSAVNDAAAGTSDPDLGAGLAAVLAGTRIRRAAHDLAFAAALAAHTSSDPQGGSGNRDEVAHLEDLLPQVILPLARRAPVLLLVLDGMSAAVGTEVLASVLSRAGGGWAEALLPGQVRRAAALAVLPTLTEVSRASLLCGELRDGGQETENKGYRALATAAGVPGAVLFHKKPLDSSRLGYAVADDVAAALADVSGSPLVTCVLNTIDDALDRSDPGGTDWGADAVKHLAPLLDRARNAGRIVVLTADHGHIVERRQGTQRPHADISSSRSRAAAEPAGDGEVLVAGRRVLRHDGRAVLAVDERLRYGPLKAGYHGGGAPAEAVVPVAVLVPGAVPEGVDDLTLAPPQEPGWWIDPVEPVAPLPAAAPPAAPTARSAAGPRKRAQPDATLTLFDEPSRPGSEAVPPAEAASPVPAAVLKSAVYAAGSAARARRGRDAAAGPRGCPG
jgi:PglZ domain